MKIRDNRGFTGVDISISIVILMLFVPLITALYYNLATSSKKTQRESEATSIAVSKIEEYKAMDYYKINTGTIEEVKGEYKIITTVESYKESTKNENIADIIKKVKVSVNYWVGKKENKVEMETLITKNQNINVGQIADDNKIYTDSDGDKAKIPKGFMIVPGCEDISEGLVISDNSGDTEKSSTNKIANGNQFVWIPVDGNNPFQRRQGYYNGSLDSDYADYAEVDSTGNNSQVQENQAIKNEAKAMYASVATNGGFYIGRYEAGIESVTPRANGDPITADKVVVQKNKNVYNYVGWSNSGTMTTITGGAVELARNFATQQGYDISKVHSTLCYGVQWDTALNFIDPGYTGYAKDSTEKGNYSGNFIKTGTNDNYKMKNIYDMAGNVYEWTMESYYTDSRAVRGGNYSGLHTPASTRDNFNPDCSNYDHIGFRVALYL